MTPPNKTPQLVAAMIRGRAEEYCGCTEMCDGAQTGIAFESGALFGYQLGLESAQEIIGKMEEALKKYECKSCWENSEDYPSTYNQMNCSDFYSSKSVWGGFAQFAGKKAKEALSALEEWRKEQK